MKTADLIPLILIELADGDKYGFELTKSIEDKSNRQIQIKQPTLYTVLKKLEKSKFISSYWQDSEIGGKRHYYKITENGRAQIATLPSFSVCIENILNEDQQEIDGVEHVEEFGTLQEENMQVTAPAENNEKTTSLNFNTFEHVQPTPVAEQKQSVTEDNFSIMDLIMDSGTCKEQAQEAAITNSTELFNTDNLDTKTELEVNKTNSNFLKDENKQKDEKFAENKEITKFVEKIVPTQQEITINDNNLTQNIVEPKLTNADYAFNDVKYVDYIDFRTKKNYVQAKKYAKFDLIKTFITSIYAIIMLVISATFVKNNVVSALYYVIFVLAIVATLANFAKGVLRNQDLRLKLQNNSFKPNFKLHLICNSVITLVVIVLAVISSILVGNNTIYRMFSSVNFANLYAPILLTTIIWFDLLLAYVQHKIVFKTDEK